MSINQRGHSDPHWLLFWGSFRGFIYVFIFDGHYCIADFALNKWAEVISCLSLLGR